MNIYTKQSYQQLCRKCNMHWLYLFVICGERCLRACWSTVMWFGKPAPPSCTMRAQPVTHCIPQCQCYHFGRTVQVPATAQDPYGLTAVSTKTDTPTHCGVLCLLLHSLTGHVAHLTLTREYVADAFQWCVTEAEVLYKERSACERNLSVTCFDSKAIECYFLEWLHH